MKQEVRDVRAIVRIVAVAAITAFVCVSVMGARKGKPQSGFIKDGVFADTANRFSVRVSDDWKAKVGSAESDVRLALVHENPPVERPKNWRNRSNLKNVCASSKVRFIIFSSRCSSKDVVDSMISDASSWKIREELWTDMKPTLSGSWTMNRVAHLSRRPVTVAARKAVQWRGKICYSSMGAESEMEMGLFLTAIECEKHTLLVAASCEASIMDWLSGETTKVLDSLKFVP